MSLFLLLNKSNPHDHMEPMSFIESGLQEITPNVGVSTRQQGWVKTIMATKFWRRNGASAEWIAIPRPLVIIKRTLRTFHKWLLRLHSVLRAQWFSHLDILIISMDQAMGRVQLPAAEERQCWDVNFRPKPQLQTWCHVSINTIVKAWEPIQLAAPELIDHNQSDSGMLGFDEATEMLGT